MTTKLRSLTVAIGLFTTLLTCNALADTPPAAPGTPAATPAAKPASAATTPAVAPATNAATAPAAGQQTREQLLEELKKANTQLADDKKAVAAVPKGDKAALKTAQDKVKADGKAIFEINQKLHALKVEKKAAATKAPAAKP